MNSPNPWHAAQDLEQLCALGARFMRGEGCGFPGWGFEDLDEESEPLRDRLEALQDRGFLTLASQPGARFEDHASRHVEQRAFVLGFMASAAPELLRLEALDGRDGLAVRVFRPGTATALAEWPAATCDGEPFLFVGADARAAELELFEDEIHPKALSQLERAAYVVCIDLQFGRGPRLWEELAGALGASSAAGAGAREIGPPGSISSTGPIGSNPKNDQP